MAARIQQCGRAAGAGQVVEQQHGGRAQHVAFTGNRQVVLRAEPTVGHAGGHAIERLELGPTLHCQRVVPIIDRQTLEGKVEPGALFQRAAAGADFPGNQAQLAAHRGCIGGIHGLGHLHHFPQLMGDHAQAEAGKELALVELHVVEARGEPAHPANPCLCHPLDGRQRPDGDGETTAEALFLHMAVEPLERPLLVAQIALEDAGVVAHGDKGVELDRPFRCRVGRGPQAQIGRHVAQGEDLFAQGTGRRLQQQQIDLFWRATLRRPVR